MDGDRGKNDGRRRVSDGGKKREERKRAERKEKRQPLSRLIP